MQIENNSYISVNVINKNKCFLQLMFAIKLIFGENDSIQTSFAANWSHSITNNADS